MNYENKDILFLEFYENKDFSRIIRNNGIEFSKILRLFKISTKILRIIKSDKILFLLFYKWKYNLYQYSVLIIPASKLTPLIVRYIRNVNEVIRIIVWYSNSVEYEVKTNMFDKLDCELWSFDEADCLNYNLKFNTQYYFKPDNVYKREIKWDVFFIGNVKGRLKEISEIYEILENRNISKNILVVSNKKINDKYIKNSRKEKYSNVIKMIEESKAILDITQYNQIGISLRPLEAMFYNKKLITNNLNIKNYRFYNSDNILVGACGHKVGQKGEICQLIQKNKLN